MNNKNHDLAMGTAAEIARHMAAGAHNDAWIAQRVDEINGMVGEFVWDARLNKHICAWPDDIAKRANMASRAVTAIKARIADRAEA